MACNEPVSAANEPVSAAGSVTLRFIGVHPGEHAAFHHAVAAIDQRWQKTAGITARQFQLHHLGTEVSEQLAAPRSGGIAAEFGDTEAGQGPGAIRLRHCPTPRRLAKTTSTSCIDAAGRQASLSLPRFPHSMVARAQRRCS